MKSLKELGNSIAIFDIDGCISDDEWRQSLIKESGSDRYFSYHDRIWEDKPLVQGSIVLNHSVCVGEVIVFITARPEYVRDMTVQWIREHFPNISIAALFMRSDDEEGIGAVEIKHRKLIKLSRLMRDDQIIVAAYDDRPDIIKLYLDQGISGARILDKEGVREYAGQPTVLAYSESVVEPDAELAPRTAADILAEAASTFREKNALYKDNAENVGKVLAAMFPDGINLKTPADHKMYHLITMVVGKLTRFANSGLTHQDSIRDLVVYAALVESILGKHEIVLP